MTREMQNGASRGSPHRTPLATWPRSAYPAGPASLSGQGCFGFCQKAKGVGVERSLSSKDAPIHLALPQTIPQGYPLSRTFSSRPPVPHMHTRRLTSCPLGVEDSSPHPRCP